jgi:hypothetical protein
MICDIQSHDMWYSITWYVILNHMIYSIQSQAMWYSITWYVILNHMIYSIQSQDMWYSITRNVVFNHMICDIKSHDIQYSITRNGLLFRSEFFFRTTWEFKYLFLLSRKARNFFQNPILGYMTKTLNQIIFFSSTKIRIFFSATLGIRILF